MKNMWECYIELLECEINDLVCREVKHGCLTWEAEKQLHILFENRKHAMRMMEDHHRHTNPMHHNPGYNAPRLHPPMPTAAMPQ